MSKVKNQTNSTATPRLTTSLPSTARSRLSNSAITTGYGDGVAGDYGPDSEGFDHLGYGTVMFAKQKPHPKRGVYHN